MSKNAHHGHQRHVSIPAGAKSTLQQQVFAGTDLTPGRDPAEGPDIEFSSPIHERWAQDTFDRDPAEGPILAAPTSGAKAGRAR
ncbi:hypothetical protein Gbem_4077 [Citrifermentans bemidjiense Bem]|uniref:Uncharacterized protein n=1 Tax=Citrifermentans bemidjiense (strain ATCC BAA-1014 / DSM 16622 / JCM 12645 / Bem) TaxID=404380 RepID=E1P685_CITBB|nr:hypothetical protein Gbem_4077 [Citrifermentans bemidjiense Bem]